MADVPHDGESKRFLNHGDGDERDDSFDVETSYRQSSQQKACCKSRRLTTILAIILFPLGILIGSTIPYSISLWSKSHNNNGGLLAPVGTIEQIWEHNLTFSQHPTPESEAAWGDLVPVGRGFIHEPEIAPFISNIAAFHQLHCLHAIFLAYYSAADVASGIPVDNKLWEPEITTRHIRHCFDYLRRTIMCYADTNLEVLDQHHATNGWGQKKICRDWNSVFEFAERYANSTDKGIIDH